MGHTVLCASRRISSVFAPPSLNLKILLFSCAYMQNEPHSRSSQEQGLLLQFALHVRATPESSMHFLGSLPQNKATKGESGWRRAPGRPCLRCLAGKAVWVTAGTTQR